MLVAIALFAPLVSSAARPFQPLPIIQQVKGCMDKMANNYNPDANLDDGSCKYGAGNPMALLPKIQPYMYDVKVSGNNVSVSWLSSFSSKGAVLVSSDPSDYALNDFGRAYAGDPAKVEQLGGFELVIEDSGFWTYHQLSFNLPVGTWYVRPISWVWSMTADYTLGEERMIVIK